MAKKSTKRPAAKRGAPVSRARKPAAPAKVPKIGAKYQGGIYAGLTLHDNKPMALILLPGERENITWDDAVKWAAKYKGKLPSRVDQLVLRENVKAQFKDATYWSGAQYAGNDAYAWAQHFNYGTQNTYHKDDEFRARAVRRLPIE